MKKLILLSFCIGSAFAEELTLGAINVNDTKLSDEYEYATEVVSKESSQKHRDITLDEKLSSDVSFVKFKTLRMKMLSPLEDLIIRQQATMQMAYLCMFKPPE